MDQVTITVPEKSPTIPTITDDNFSEYFHDVRKHRPQKGQILASWRASADFIDGWVKREVIDQLNTSEVGAESAVKIMRKLVGAIEKDAILVCLGIAEDLLSKMSMDAILKKPYHFTIEQFYWTMPEYVPDDPHWTTTKVCDLTQGEIPDFST